MNRALALLIIGLVFGGGIGFVIAAANGVTLDGHDHATDHGPTAGADHAAMGHDHSETLDITGPPPSLTLTLTDDPVSGWNLHLATQNFRFAASNAGAGHINGEGHAHLYANGIKIARLYGPWFHIDALPEGTVNLLVTLNSNDHKVLATGGTPIQATLTLTNP